MTFAVIFLCISPALSNIFVKMLNKKDKNSRETDAVPPIFEIYSERLIYGDIRIEADPEKVNSKKQSKKRENKRKNKKKEKK